MMRIAPILSLAALTTLAAAQERVLGTVPMDQATVVVSGHPVVGAATGRAALSGLSVVTAGPRPAQLLLTRGGDVKICQTTALHLLASGEQSILFALDRGSVEMKMKSAAGDSVMTPDLSLALTAAAPLDLSLRVARNGDTCIDNHGRHAPPLTVTETFSGATYQVAPGQHVLFEHGSVHEVVDHETTPCGCPEEVRAVPLAQALLSAPPGTVTPQQTAAANPFPAAVSQGLEEPKSLPPQQPGETHVQVTQTLTYNPTAPPPTPPPAAPPPAKHTGGGPFGAIGRFFKKLFVR